MTIEPELVERMVALVREMGGNSSIGMPFDEASAVRYSSTHYSLARGIVDALPKPVDPDLIEARKMAADAHPQVTTTNFLDGRADKGCAVQYRLAGIKRGRELATESAS